MREEPASFLLSLISGFVDTAGFIALGGLFTAHMTGNLVLAGASIVQGADGNVASRLLMIPIFMVAVALTKKLRRYAFVLGGFVLGAAGGAYGIANLHFWCILIPLLMTGILAVASAYDSMKTRASATVPSSAR